MTQKYSLSEVGLASQLANLKQRTAIFLGVISCFTFGLVLWFNQSSWPYSLPVALLTFPVVFMGWKRAIRLNQQVLENLVIEVGENYLSRSQPRISPIRVEFSEITLLEESEPGLCVRTANPNRTLFIPAELENYTQLKAELAHLAPLQPVTAQPKSKNMGLTILLIVAFGILFFSWSIWLTLLAGGGLLAYYANYYWQIRQLEGVDPQFKRSMGLAVGMILFVTSTKVCALSGFLGEL